ncbi:putative membrane protein YadS [Mycobacteroides chelonae]|nr:putative membrane protein YadS [Mycobacteroides chelonae]
MTVADTIILVAAKWFGLSGKLGSLLAIGTSICGVSAIIAAKGAIRARNSNVSYAIASILALGVVALFTLPAVGHGLGLTDHEFGLWAARGEADTLAPRIKAKAAFMWDKFPEFVLGFLAVSTVVTLG